MTEALLIGVLASSHMYGTLPHKSLQLDVTISKELELLYYSQLPVQFLCKTQCLRMVGITMSSISLKSLQDLSILNSVPSGMMKLVLHKCLVSESCLSEEKVFQTLLYLTALDITNCILSTNMVIAIAELLRVSRKLRYFQCYCNNTNETDTDLILHSIGMSNSLTAVLCRHVLSITNAQLLFYSLQNPHCKIERINLSYCSLTHHSASELGRYLECTPPLLLDLNIYGNNLDSRSLQLLACGLKHNQSLRSLNIGLNVIGDDGIYFLSEALVTNTCLEQLLATKTSTGSKGLCILSAALQKNRRSSLKRLDLSWNLVGDDGAQSMAQLLHRDRSLLHINLIGNNIGSIGASYIAVALRTNKTLKTLYLADNQIDSRGINYLKNMCERNPYLQTLDLVTA